MATFRPLKFLDNEGCKLMTWETVTRKQAGKADDHFLYKTQRKSCAAPSVSSLKYGKKKEVITNSFILLL